MPNRHAAPPAVKASSTVAPLRAAEPAFPEGSGVDRAGLILFTLAAMQFISTVDFMIVMPLGPLLFDTLGIDTVQFSWVVSAYTFAAGCAGFAAAAVLDRVGRRSAYIALSAGLLLGTLVCGLATNYQVLVAARCLTGAFGGVFGRFVVRHRGGRVSRGAARPGDRLADVGVRCGVGGGRAHWHRAGHPLRLGSAVPRARGAGAAAVGHGRVDDAAADRPPGRDATTSPGQSAGHAHVSLPSACLGPHRHSDVRRIFRDSLYQRLLREQRGCHGGPVARRLRGPGACSRS